MKHRLHIVDEGFTSSSVLSKQVMVPYCECGWLGDRVAQLDPKAFCREQFYAHLRALKDDDQ